MGASGTTTLNFGAFPGGPEAEVDVSGQAGFVATSEVEAWVQPVATADHSVDEHRVESIRVIAQYKVDGTLTIFGYCDTPPAQRGVNYPRGSAPPKTAIAAGTVTPQGGGSTLHQPSRERLYGQFTVGWAWN